MDKRTEIAKIMLLCIVIGVLSIWIVKDIRYISMKSENCSIGDESQDFYSVSHFSGACSVNRSLTAGDGKEIVYVDGLNVYRYGDNHPILQDVYVKQIVLAYKYLYVLDDSWVLHVVDKTTFDQYVMSGVQYVGYDGETVYLKMENSQELSCISEDMIVQNHEIISREKLSVADINVNMFQEPFVRENENCYWVYSDRRGIAVYRSKFAKEDDSVSVVRLDNSYVACSDNLFIEDGKAYILYNEFDLDTYSFGVNDGLVNRPEFQRAQKKIVRDGVAAVNFDTGEVEKIYSTDNNYTKIIGYDISNDSLYLFDVRERQIYSLNLKNKERQSMFSLSKEYDYLIFEITENVLFLYDIEQNLITSVEL